MSAGQIALVALGAMLGVAGFEYVRAARRSVGAGDYLAGAWQ